MKAAVLKELHTDLSIEEMDLPDTDVGEQIVTLNFSGLNHRDVWITKGMYAGITLPLVLGSDGAGICEGRRVLINPSLNWGDDPAVQAPDYKILGLPDHGTFATHVKVATNKIHNIPDHLTDEEAAALPLAGLTAYRALVTKCRPKVGDKVLISGVGGGVALFALQLALSVGCEVYVTSGSEGKIEQAMSMGASGGVNYKDSEFASKLKKMSGGIDIVIDSAAGDGFTSLVKVCNPGGRICFYGGTAGKINGLVPQWVFWKQLSIFGSTMGTDEEFVQMLEHVTLHKIKPIVDRIYDMKDINQALARMEKGDQFGKILVNTQIK